MTLPGSALAGSSAGRPKNDFYPTPEWATRALLNRESFDGPVWEPACGDGAISEVLLSNEFRVHSSDILDYGYHGTEVKDFLEPDLHDTTVGSVITNPPFMLAQEFIERAKETSATKIAMFLKLPFLESMRRYPMFMDKNFPLARVYVFSRRVTLVREGVVMKNKGTIAFAWYVWDVSHEGPPTIHWINDKE